MIKYACGHESKGIILMDNNPLSMAAYFRWVEDEGNIESKRECFDCFIKKFKGRKMREI